MLGENNARVVVLLRYAHAPMHTRTRTHAHGRIMTFNIHLTGRNAATDKTG